MRMNHLGRAHSGRIIRLNGWDGLRSGETTCTTQLSCLIELLPQGSHIPSQVTHVASQLIEYFVEQLPLALITMIAARLTRNRRQLGRFLILRYILKQHIGRDFSLFTEYRHLFGDILELSHISRPLIFQHDNLGVITQRNLWQAILLCHLHGEETEQQKYVIASISQRWHLDRNGVQTII